jgi:hypothetical protein
MTDYRVYGLDDKGRIRFGDFVSCRSEADAVEAARHLLERFPVAEVWLGARRIAAETAHGGSGGA